jgi:lysozyme
MSDPRKPVFDAIRAAKGSIAPHEVPYIDDMLDRLGVPKAGATGRRAINKAGLELVKEFEGLRLKAYLCPAKVWTIGYGSTGSHVREGLVITEAQAEELLRSDLRRFEDAVAKGAPVATDNQFSAMVCLAFNIGEGAFAGSTVLRKHNAGDHAGAAEAFKMWSKAGGETLRGLVRRREAEAQLYRNAA